MMAPVRAFSEEPFAPEEDVPGDEAFKPVELVRNLAFVGVAMVIHLLS